MRRLLIRNATLLTMDPSLGDFDCGDLLIEGSRSMVDAGFAAIPGRRSAVEARRPERLDMYGDIPYTEKVRHQGGRATHVTPSRPPC